MSDQDRGSSTTSGSQWRRKLAWKIASHYASNEHVDAVLLGGSTASGLADRYSDIEIGVFWKQTPGEDERQEAIIHAGAGEYRLYPYDPGEEVWSDDLILGKSVPGDSRSGVLVEVMHYASSTIERFITDILDGYDPDLVKQNVAAAIHNGIALHDLGVIRQWKSRLSEYPKGLAIAMVNRYGQIDHFMRRQMWLDRGPNLMMLYSWYTQVEQKIILALMGLNRVYYCGFKWMEYIESSIPIAPTNLRRRLNDVFEVEPNEGGQILVELVEETFTLVQLHLPQVDVDRLRTVFHYQRFPLDRAPM